MGNFSRFETTATSQTGNPVPKHSISVNSPLKYAARARQNSFQLQKMIDDMHRFIASLDVEIAAEEDRAHVHDQTHYTYPITAKTMRIRRDNLMLTIAALETQLQAARHILAESAAGETVNAA